MGQRAWVRRAKLRVCVTCLVVIAGAAIACYQLCWVLPTGGAMEERPAGPWSEDVLDYFLHKGLIGSKDGVEITWEHAANSREKLRLALEGDAHMIEADVLLRGSGNQEPIMAHPPATDSDITLRDWLIAVSASNKGSKLDFKSLEAVLPSMETLDKLRNDIKQPVWINADILPGPGGSAKPVDAKEFLQTVTSFFPDVTLSLGWTTGWLPDRDNEGYSWEMVRRMAEICDGLHQSVTFPVRAALVRQSWPPLQWLLQTSSRYSLTVWAGKDDVYSVDDLLYIRESSKEHQIFYDVFEPQNSQLRDRIRNRKNQLS
ncbi:protein FAM151B [Hyperolius riggenbachi]|uniref:protein FAM151B n=1 Tax=Hyperolius riggenbachi TaxID=752182 RepID=UPI0035A37B50